MVCRKVLHHAILYTLNFLSQDPNIYSDFAYLMSQCSEVLSAEVPERLREISKAIDDPKKFVQMSDDEALEYLKSAKSNSSKKFIRFLEIHGHRGIKEFDPLAKPWKYNPIPVIQSLKV